MRFTRRHVITSFTSSASWRMQLIGQKYKKKLSRRIRTLRPQRLKSHAAKAKRSAFFNPCPLLWLHSVCHEIV